MSDATDGRLDSPVLIDQAALLSVPGKQSRELLEECLSHCLSLLFGEDCVVLLECGSDELAPPHTVDKAEVYCLGFLSLILSNLRRRDTQDVGRCSTMDVCARLVQMQHCFVSAKIG